jgi:hypothetical protein
MFEFLQDRAHLSPKPQTNWINWGPTSTVSAMNNTQATADLRGGKTSVDSFVQDNIVRAASFVVDSASRAFSLCSMM